MREEARDYDVVREGEEEVEALWKKQGGVNPEMGRMWLTPRMERNAKELEEAWKKQEGKRL